MQMHSLFRFLFKSIIKFLIPISLFIAANGYAGTGLFFKISSTEETTPLNIQLALDGRIPLTCQNYKVNGLSLIINTIVPNHTYPFAGIRIVNPGYRIAGLVPLKNDFYLFIP